MNDFPKELKPGPLEAVGLWKASRYLRRVKEILMADLVNQRSVIPTRKVAAAGGGGVVASLLIWAASRFLNVEMGPEDAALLATAIAVVTGYVMRERESSRDATPVLTPKP